MRGEHLLSRKTPAGRHRANNGGGRKREDTHHTTHNLCVAFAVRPKPLVNRRITARPTCVQIWWYRGVGGGSRETARRDHDDDDIGIACAIASQANVCEFCAGVREQWNPAGDLDQAGVQWPPLIGGSVIPGSALRASRRAACCAARLRARAVRRPLPPHALAAAESPRKPIVA